MAKIYLFRANGEVGSMEATREKMPSDAREAEKAILATLNAVEKVEPEVYKKAAKELDNALNALLDVERIAQEEEQ